MKTVHIARHATSLANLGQHWIDGPKTIPLTQDAHADARKFADEWTIKPNLICASSYLRSIQTATPLAEKFGLTIVTLPVHEFTYWNLRLSPEEHKSLKEEREAYWERLDVNERRGEGSESFVEFADRLVQFRSWLEITPFDHCVCISHGLFMHALREMMDGVSLEPKVFMKHLRDTLPGAEYKNLEVATYML